MARWVKGNDFEPREGVTLYTETCPGDAPSGGPYFAPNWARIAPGEVRFASKAAKTIAPDAGDPAIAQKFNPVGGGACETADGADQAGAASYRVEAPETPASRCWARRR